MLKSPPPIKVTYGVKDRRYAVVKSLLGNGYFTKFSEIFTILPKSVVARDLGMNNLRFSKIINRPELFLIQDVGLMARRTDVDLSVLMDLILLELKTRRQDPFTKPNP
jgi:hypothetical protein